MKRRQYAKRVLAGMLSAALLIPCLNGLSVLAADTSSTAKVSTDSADISSRGASNTTYMYSATDDLERAVDAIQLQP